MSTEPTRLGRLADALDERTGFRAARAAFLGRQIPGGPSFGRALGASVVGLTLFIMLTGVALAFIYSPSSTSAWASVATIETSVPLGSLIRGLHHFGTSVLFVLAALHLAHIVATAAYRRPNEAAWVLGLAGLLLLPLFAITGNALPNDQDGYWGLQVELGIIADAPLGGLVKKILIGGDTIGNATLTRFSVLHTVLLPAAMAGIAALHVVIARRRRAAPGQALAPAWPGQHARNVGMTVLVIGVTFVMALTMTTRLDAPADPSSAYTARPEWYFMALNQLATLFGKDLAFLGTLVLPVLFVGFLFVLPAFDKRTAGRPPLMVLAPFALIGLVMVGLTAKGVIGDANDEKLAKKMKHAEDEADAMMVAFRAGGVDASGRAPVLAGAAVYKEKGCAACHDDMKKLGVPRLEGWGTVKRLSAYLDNPDDPRFYGGGTFEGSMTAYGGTVPEREALATWLLSLGGRFPDTAPEILAQGRKIFLEDDCTECHNDPLVSPRDKRYDLRAMGPDLDGFGGPEWVRGVIREPSHPRFYGDAIESKNLSKVMPAGKDLTDEELSLLVRWFDAGAPGAK